MSGLLRRLRPTPPSAPDPVAGPTHGPPEIAVPIPAPLAEPVAPDAAAQGDAAATEHLEEHQLPAGVAPEELIGEPPATRRRSRLRRRLRHLRRVRELMLRDVGGLTYEIHRAPAGDDAARGHRAALVNGKLERLAALDAERRELEATLGDRGSETVLREPGVGGTCASCGEYLPSDARFCAHCGVPVAGTPAAASAGPGAEEPPDGGARAASAEEPVTTPARVEPRTEVRS